MYKNVGKKMKELRTSRGITASFLAGILDIHPSTLGKYESGDRRVDADFVPKIAEALGVEISNLYEKVDDSSISNSA